MALNGLDAPDVTNAYKTTLANPDGWFLLQYSSRDHVCILNKGNGFDAATDTLANFAEKSPVYGLVHHESRKKLLKYIPEGTSRLLIARTTVHFRAVTEAFSDHDEVLSITQLEDLSPKSALARETSGGQSSDAKAGGDESRQDPKIQVTHFNGDTGTFATRESKEDNASFKESLISTSTNKDAIESLGTSTPRNGPESRLSPSMAGKPVASRSNEIIGLKAFLTDVTPPASTRIRQNPPAVNRHSSDSSADIHLVSPDEAFFKNSLNSRPSAAELFRHFKPKTRLFPRPANNEKMRKPQPEGGFRQKLPAGLRAKPRNPEGERPQTSKTQTTSPIASPSPRTKNSKAINPRPPPKDELLIRSKTEPLPPSRINTESLNSKELPLPPSPSVKSPVTNELESDTKSTPKPKTKPRPTLDLTKTHSSSDVNSPLDSPDIPVRVPSLLSPEKQRLMKALQLRKQQQKHMTSSPDLPPESTLDSEGKEFFDTMQTTDSSKADSAIDMERRVVLDYPPPLITMVKATPMPRVNGLDMHPLRSQPVNIDDLISKKQDELKDEGSEAFTNGEANESHSIADPDRAKSPVEYIDVDKLDADAREPTSTFDNDSPAGQVRARAKRKAKRRGIFEPLELPQEKEDEHDETKSLSEDNINEDLEEAKVEEATTVKIPPLLQRTTSASGRSVTFSNVDRHDKAESSQNDRSPKRQRFMNGITGRPTQERSGSYAKRSNLSSDISKRIKALADMSTRGSPPVSPLEPPASNQSSRPFLSMRTRSSQTGMRRNSLTFSRQSSPPRSRPQTANAAPSLGPSLRPLQARPLDSARRRESSTISVLIRDPQGYGAGQHQTINDVIEESPHMRSPSNVSYARSEIMPPGIDTPRPDSRQSNIASIKRKSIDRGARFVRRIDSKYRPPTSMSNTSLERVDEQSDEGKVSVTSSRATRLLRRMSGLSAAIRKPASDARNARMSRDGSSTALSMTREQLPPQAVAVGDLNVQFPDTLLWKRRWVEIDAVGNLVLSAARVNERARGIKKKFHLSEFRPPFMPPDDRQEMPNSIILDIIGGGALQLACEDPIAQSQIYRRITDTQRAWLVYGQ